MKELIKRVIDPNGIEAISSKSENILDVFTKTVEDLNDLNVKIDKQAAKKEEERLKITSQLDLLSKMKAQHGKVIQNIKKILE